MIEEKHLRLKRLVDIYYDVQDVRMRTENRLRINVPSETRGTYPERLQDIEKGLKLEIMQLVQDEPIWKAFLGKWRGIGPCIAGGLIAGIMVRFAKREPQTDLEKRWSLKTKDKKTLVPDRRGIEAFDTPSKLWAFCGQSLKDGHAQWREHGGGPINWNPKMRVLVWKLEKQTVMQGRYYRTKYDAARAIYDARPDLQQGVWINPRTGKIGKGAKGHRMNMAMKKMGKQFLLDLWIAWRRLEGLPIRQPYAIEKLGHKGYQAPPPLGDREGTETFQPNEN